LKNSCVKTQQQDETLRIWQYIASAKFAEFNAHEVASSQRIIARFSVTTDCGNDWQF
jgi:hypothetical protein